MNKRQQQKENTKNHLIETAIKCFAENGFGATRTADIAQAASVSHGTIFAHFPTKENLLAEVIEEFGNRISQRLHELVDNNCEMKDLLQAHLKGIAEYEKFYSRLISEINTLNKSAKNTLLGVQSVISFHMSIVAQRELDEGKIVETSFDLMFNTWLGLINYYLINWELFAPNGSVISSYGDKLIKHYIKLISNK